jgi:hypothetical protein
MRENRRVRTALTCRSATGSEGPRAATRKADRRSRERLITDPTQSRQLGKIRKFDAHNRGNFGAH